MVSHILYGATTLLDAALVTSHSVNLSGLSASTPYHYRGQIQGCHGQPRLILDQTFTTTTPDTTAPLISGVTVYSIGSSSATINWNTNEPADSRIGYGLNAGYGSQTDSTRARDVALPDSTRISVRRPSIITRSCPKDSSGNPASSPDDVFTTAGARTPPPAWSACGRMMPAREHAADSSSSANNGTSGE